MKPNWLDDSCGPVRPARGRARFRSRVRGRAGGEAALVLVLVLTWAIAALPATSVNAAAPAATAPASAAAGAKAARDPLALTAEKYTLPSGMSVLLHRDPAVPRVVVSLWFNVGSKDEAPGKTGFAHLYEHLMFMGTKNVPNSQFDQLMEAEGGNNNASTSNDRTFYYDLGPSHLLPTLLWLEAERLTNLPAAMTAQKVDLQREVVRNERRQSYENRPYGMAELRMIEALYPKGHPYSWPVIGSHQDLINATTADVKQFFYTYYVPSNATLAVVGDIDIAATKRLINTYFGWMPKTPPPKLAGWSGPPLQGPVERRVTLNDRVALPRVYMAWHAPPVQSPAFAAVQLAMAALGEGKASRLYRSLVVEQKLAGEVELDVEPLSLGSLITLSVTAQKGVSEGALQAAIDKELARLRTAPLTDHELARARSQLITDIARRVESLIGQTHVLQELNAWFGDPSVLPKRVEQLRQVTVQSAMAQVQALGIADPNRRLQLSVLPSASAAPPAAELPPAKPAAVAAAEAAEAARPAPKAPIDLSKGPQIGAMKALSSPKVGRYKSGGVDVLLVNRPGAPLLESVVVIPAGETASPADKIGLAGAVAAMLTEGAGDRDAIQFADALEELGATIDAHATLDSTLVSLSVLPEHYAEAAALLGDAVLRPHFTPADWQRTRGELLANLAHLRDEPRYNAERALVASLLGDQHPYARPVHGDDAAFARMQVDDLQRFHRAHYGRPTLVVVGDLSLDAATAKRLAEPLASRLTGGSSPSWDPAPATAAAPLPPAQPHRGLVLIDKPGAPQSELRVANLAGARLDPARGALDLGNMLLGGMFTSRLNQNLREQHGYTYGAQTLFVRHKDAGWFVADAAVRSDVTAESLAETLKELQRIRGETIGKSELQKGQKAQIQHLVAQSEHAAGLALTYAHIARYGLPLNELQRLGQAAQTATAADLQRVLRAEIRPDEATVIVVGDVKKLAAKLRGVAGLPAPAPGNDAPQYRDLDGHLVPGAGPTPAPAAPPPAVRP